MALSEEELRAKMDEVADTESHLDLVISERETLKKSIIPPEILMEMETIDFEFADRIKAIEDNIKTRKDQLQILLKEYAKPLKSKYYSWSYKPSDPVWDGRGLDGFALTHPEILYMRTEGKPSTKLSPLKK